MFAVVPSGRLRLCDRVAGHVGRTQVCEFVSSIAVRLDGDVDIVPAIVGAGQSHGNQCNPFLASVFHAVVVAVVVYETLQRIGAKFCEIVLATGGVAGDDDFSELVVAKRSALSTHCVDPIEATGGLADLSDGVARCVRRTQAGELVETIGIGRHRLIHRIAQIVSAGDADGLRLDANSIRAIAVVVLVCEDIPRYS